MKSNFDKQVKKIMEDCVAGGADSVFSTGDIQAGIYGNQFPAQNDLAYAPGDARYPFFIPKKSKKKKKKSKKILVQRRQLSENNGDYEERIIRRDLMQSIHPGEVIVSRDKVIGIAYKLKTISNGIQQYWDTIGTGQGRVLFFYSDIDWEVTKKIKGLDLADAQAVVDSLSI